MRGAGIGALAGAAISIEALDLGRLLLRGHTFAGAADRRDARGGRAPGLVGHRTRSAGHRGRRATRPTAVGDLGGRGQHAALHHLETALAEGDVEFMLHQLLTGVVVTHTQMLHGGGGGGGDMDEDTSIVIRDGDEAGDGGGGAAALIARHHPLVQRRQSGQSQLHQLLERLLVQANVDSMSYEELLDRFGPGVDGPAAAPASLISTMPRQKLSGEDVEAAASDETQEWRCCICLEEYCKGDVVKCLPACSHRFHAGCIDKWLTGRNLCPICRMIAVVKSGGNDAAPAITTVAAAAAVARTATAT